MIAATTTGCTTSPTTNKGTGMNPLAQLQTLPSSEDTVTTYTAMEAEIRDAVTNAAPTTTWVLEDEQSQSGCRESFSNLGGRTVILASYGAPTPIPDAAWPAALAAAATIARRNGFTNTQVKVDDAGNHQVRFTNPTDGAYTDLGTRKAVVLLTSTGCHLPAGSRPTG